jgi:XTP/dITP diphosphohydrolase
LRGAPGIYSARYAGQNATDLANLQKLLADLVGMPAPQRTARYQCALAFLRWELDPSPLVVQAHWDGHIVETPSGSGGFGYDPIFQPLGHQVTVAELPSDEKNRLSHRGQALRRLVEQLSVDLKGAA